LINYQGRLTDANGDPVTGTKNFAISIYDAATNGTLLYTETIGAVTLDENGVYSFQFGEDDIPAALATGAGHWLQLTCDGIIQNPRQKILAVPFAIKSATSDQSAIANTVIDGAITAAKLSPTAVAESMGNSGSLIASNSPRPELLNQGYSLFNTLSNNPYNYLDNLDTPSNLASRAVHTAVWTGNEMIVWGGTSSSNNANVLNSGSIYNPTTNTWRTTATLNAPSARNFHTAVWTGKEMIVWGGYDGNGSGRNDGGRYYPITDTWIPINTNNAPTKRDRHITVWTGTEMIVWGTASDSKAYNPITDTWRLVSNLGAPTIRRDAQAVWTGSRMIVWGGSWESSFPNTGGCYDPVADTWTAMNTTNAPKGRSGHTAIWTGAEMIVWGGCDGSGNYLNDGGRYNPTTNTWSTTTSNSAPSVRASHSAIWTGSKMIVYGGYAQTHLADGRSYDPANDVWSTISSINTPISRSGHTAVWTGSEMIIFGGFNSSWNASKDTLTYSPPKLIYFYQRP
jgi:hypothetical protein